ncbi:hypothetical protein AB0L05_01360 [Nonomuraea pusilla]|uniref:hypothetical protein n=1 Tax=Nonomuraea pusilla TaxID=46177 RepID=UPI00332C14C0
MASTRYSAIFVAIAVSGALTATPALASPEPGRVQGSGLAAADNDLSRFRPDRSPGHSPAGKHARHASPGGSWGGPGWGKPGKRGMKGSKWMSGLGNRWGRNQWMGGSGMRWPGMGGSGMRWPGMGGSGMRWPGMGGSGMGWPGMGQGRGHGMRGPGKWMRGSGKRWMGGPMGGPMGWHGPGGFTYGAAHAKKNHPADPNAACAYRANNAVPVLERPEAGSPEVGRLPQYQRTVGACAPEEQDRGWTKVVAVNEHKLGYTRTRALKRLAPTDTIEF